MSAESTATNYYAVLKISQDASLQEINAAYKRLALKYHPDKSGEESVETFHQVCHDD